MADSAGVGGKVSSVMQETRIFPPPAEFTTGQARAALSTSRKFIVPALEFLDSRGDTVRRGDSRQVVTQRKRFGTPPIPH
jgi:hypothetical protein